MFYPEENETKQDTDAVEIELPRRDASANLESTDDADIPRVKGLIELLNDYFGNRLERDR